jgi:HAE1 family hydrophobic/amphiphilic exporter-1
MDELYKQAAGIPGVALFMKSFPLISLDVGTQVNKGAYQYSLQCFHQEDLYKYAPIFVDKMRTLPGFKHVVSDLAVNAPEINITIDRDMASSFNVTAQQIEQTLAYAYGGTKISLINTPLNQYYVILETLPSAYKDPTMLNKIYISDMDQNLVPLNQITHWESTVGPLTVNHTNTMPSVLISFDLDGIPLSTALNDLSLLAKEVLPKTVSSQLFGSASAFTQTFSDLIFLLLIAFFVIYVILGVLYENFIHPITVMSTLPPAALSGLITLLIFGQTISLYAFVGFIMLLGIVMKNGIILIDFANEAVLTGLYDDPEAAIKYSAVTRFRPIIMTTFSTLMGALPIAMGIGGLTAESRKPVGLVIVGGLLFSQLLTLFLTPVTYIYMEKMRRSFSKKGNKKDSNPEPIS